MLLSASGTDARTHTQDPMWVIIEPVKYGVMFGLMGPDISDDTDTDTFTVNVQPYHKILC